MKTIKINQDRAYAKLLALSVIYEKEESCRNEFLEKISYRPKEITVMLDSVPDCDFRRWVQSVIPVMNKMIK